VNEKPPPAAADWRPLAAALVSVCLWASAFVGIRAAGHAFSPGALGLGRLLVGTVTLGLLSASRPFLRPTRRELLLLLTAGVLWLGLYNIALNEAERRIDAGTAAMLVNIAPILVLALAAVALGEPLTRMVLVGSVVAFGGVLVIGLATRSGSAPLSGVMLCLAAALTYSVGVVAQKPVLGRLPALQVTWLCCAVGVLVCLPYAAVLLRELPHASTTEIAWVVYLGVFPTAVGFTTWGYALARGSVGRLAATTYLVSPIAILMSWAILGEVPTLLAVLGGIVCLTGVYVARRS
jgi:drug/metabolite transporter (DMT)-like permease